MTDLKKYLNLLLDDVVLEQQETSEAITAILSGDASPVQTASFLSIMAMRGNTAQEIAAAANVLRNMMSTTINAPEGAVDCCGTGGDASGTYNISTAVALVSAGAGIPVAKHGNRAASSKSGAADVLEELGVNLDLKAQQLETALSQFNFCFLMAPHHHSAMKNVAPIRKELGFRTIFNVLGPLANPAGTQYQLIGVYDHQLVLPLAQVLKELGTKRAWVVHGTDGLDEITTTADTNIAMLDETGNIEFKTLSPADFGLPVADMNDLKGGDAAVNAAAIRELLDGSPSAYRDIVLANTAAVLMIAGKARTLTEAVAKAAESIDSGKAKDVLEGYAAFTRQEA